MVSFLKKIVGDTPERAAEKLRGQLVPQINRLEDSVQTLDDSGLRAKTDEFRRRIDDGESLDSLLPEAFAVVREAGRRTLGQRHYDVQLIGGAVLHQGKIAEMKTGEGKTLVATLPAYLNALSGDGVHVVTVNDYLARRDPVWMGPIYNLLGLSVGCLQHDAAYIYDPELTDAGRGGFDYLTPVNRGDYYQGLRKPRETGDWNPLVAFFDMCLANQAMRWHHTLTQLDELAQRWRDHPDLSTTAKQAATSLLANPYTCASHLAANINASQSVARKVIQEMKEACIVQDARPAGNTKMYLAADVPRAAGFAIND